MQSITNGAPKELLKLGRKTVLQRIIEEAQESDPDRVIVIGSPTKPQLSLAATELGATVELQVHQVGLADAIVSAGVEDDAIILLGDCVYSGGSPVHRMAELVRKGIDGCIAVEPTDDDGTRLYGMVEVDEFSGGIRGIMEKPGPDATVSRWAVAARFAFSVRLMAFIEGYVQQNRPEEGKELSITPILQRSIEEGFDLKAVPLQSGHQRVDCGSPEEYQQARSLNWD